MNMDDSWLTARFQRLITELLIEKRLGQRRPELTDELYQTWLEVDQRGLKETPVPKRPVERRSARFVARRIGEAQQPRRCTALLFKRTRAHRHAQRFARGGVTDGQRFINAALPLCAPRPLPRDKANAHERANAIDHGPFRPRTDCWDHVADRGRL